MATIANKFKWKDVYDEFCRSHPRLSKDVSYWRPFDYATIIIYFKNNTRMIYNCVTKDCKFVN